MPDYRLTTLIDLIALDAEVELNALFAESMGQQPLGQGAYLHYGAKVNPEAQEMIQVVGLHDTALAGLKLLLMY